MDGQLTAQVFGVSGLSKRRSIFVDGALKIKGICLKECFVVFDLGLIFVQYLWYLLVNDLGVCYHC